MPPSATVAEAPAGTWSAVAPLRRRAPVVETARQVITICHPVWQLGRGGLERQLLQTISHLPYEKFRHVLVVRGCDEDGMIGDQACDDNVTVIRQQARKKERLWPVRLASILRDHSVDVLHVRGMTMLMDALVAARIRGDTAVAFSFHGIERAGAGFGPMRRRMYRAAVARCDDRWAVSPAAAKAIASELRMAPDQFGVLPNGVDTGLYVPAGCPAEIRRRLNLPKDRTVVLTVGNLKPIKGHDVLLEAIRQLRGDTDQLTVVLVGGDYLDGALQRWAAEHLPDADIRFVGRQGDTLPWYQAADLFVLPSRWEGMSNALLEAMSCGLPVISTSIGGNQDVIDHGRTGLLVAPGSPVELGLAIRRLMKDEVCRDALARAARRHVQNEYAASIAAARYERRVTRLVRQGRSRESSHWIN